MKNEPLIIVVVRQLAEEYGLPSDELSIKAYALMFVRGQKAQLKEQLEEIKADTWIYHHRTLRHF